MIRIVLNLILLVGLFFSLIVLASAMSEWRLPDNQQGYAPRQPIDYSHRLHAGELQIDCRFCHTHADKSRHAGIPHQLLQVSFPVQIASAYLDLDQLLAILTGHMHGAGDTGVEAVDGAKYFNRLRRIVQGVIVL